MQEDFHYYGTFCASALAGFSFEESLTIAYSAQLVDLCSKTFLTKLRAPAAASTTMLSMEMMDQRTDIPGLQYITEVWASFHFLPGDLYAKVKWRPKCYMDKYRLICRPDSDLAVRTVKLAKGSSLQHMGIAMHVIADTWAHAYFAGTPSLVINNTDGEFYEIFPGDVPDKKIRFVHKTSLPDDLENSVYINSLYQMSENSVMNLGHGRAGHLPDYSFARYRYQPAWGGYREIIKDNPSDYRRAFSQMVYALSYLRGDEDDFVKGVYDTRILPVYEERIGGIIDKRRLSASEDWKEYGQELCGFDIPDFDLTLYQREYMEADKKDDTFLGRFFSGAIAHKGMVTGEIFDSGNFIAGIMRKRGGRK